MLDLAYFYNSKEVDHLITKGDYKYLSFSQYRNYSSLEFVNDEWDKIQRVSVNNDGKILAYFSATPNYHQQKIASLYLVKFKHNYDSDEDDKTVKKDLHEFISSLVKDNRFRIIEFMAVAENLANKTYVKWLREFGGYRHLFYEYNILQDGKPHDVYYYVIDKKTIYKEDL